MQRLEVIGAVRPIYASLGFKGLIGGGEYPGNVCDIGFETHNIISYLCHYTPLQLHSRYISRIMSIICLPVAPYIKMSSDP